MRLYQPKNELGRGLLNEGQLVSSSKNITKALSGGSLVLTDSDVSGDIGDWSVKSVYCTIGGQEMSFGPEIVYRASGIEIRVSHDGETIDGLSSVRVVLGRTMVSGIASEEEEELTIDVLIAQAISTGDNTKVDEYVDGVIAGKDKDEIQALGAKLGDSGIEEYSLAWCKTTEEARGVMTGSNMGAFSSPIATLGEYNTLVLNNTDFGYNMMSLEKGNKEGGCDGLFRNSNVASFNSVISSLTNGCGMFGYSYGLTSFTSELPSLSNGSYMFERCTSLTSFTSELPSLENGNGMFQDCSNLTPFTSDLPSLSDGSYMFYGCSKLSSFTSELSSLSYCSSMFYGCDSLTYCEPKNCKNSKALNQIINSLPTYSKADGSHMILFSTGDEVMNLELAASALEKGWGVGTEEQNEYYYYGAKAMKAFYYNLVDGQGMFSWDDSLREWHYDMPNLENGAFMFVGCSNLTTFTSDLSSLTEGACMFSSCSKLTSFTSDLSSLTKGDGMFNGCSKLTSFTVELPSLTNGYGMFGSCSNLTSFTSEFPKLTNGGNMFYGCKLDTPSIQRIANSLPTYTDGTHGMYITSGATTVKQEEIDAHKLIESKGWSNVMNFRNVVGEVKDVDFSGITNASFMFYACSGLTSWTMSLPESLTNASSMFSICSGLTSWTMSLPESLTNASSMFSSCSSLTSWNGTLPDSLSDASFMFYFCIELTSWTVALPQSLTNTSFMFNSCINLTSFTPWGKNEDGTLKDTGATGKLVNGYQMFHLCKLDLASVKRIADWLPQRTSSKPIGSEGYNGWIHIGVAQGVNSGTDFNNAISKMTGKNWSVVICVNGAHTTK